MGFYPLGTKKATPFGAALMSKLFSNFYCKNYDEELNF
jgi:hypothetical protein